jgi:hypothetical protein
MTLARAEWAATQNRVVSLRYENGVQNTPARSAARGSVDRHRPAEGRFHGRKVVDHHIAIHHVREASSNQRAWDVAFLAFGTLVILLVGASLDRREAFGPPQR